MEAIPRAYARKGEKYQKQDGKYLVSGNQWF